jgi:hypothetical protein
VSERFPRFEEVRARLDSDGTPTPDFDRLPPNARRWLTHALPSGRPAPGRVFLRIEGEIRLKGWTPFRSREVLAPRSGFAWEATAGRFPMVIRGMDYYVAGAGGMRWRVAG